MKGTTLSPFAAVSRSRFQAQALEFFRQVEQAGQPTSPATVIKSATCADELVLTAQGWRLTRRTVGRRRTGEGAMSTGLIELGPYSTQPDAADLRGIECSWRVNGEVFKPAARDAYQTDGSDAGDLGLWQ